MKSIVAAILSAVVAAILSRVFIRDKIRILVRTVVRDNETVTHAFLFEVNNNGMRDITINEFGFVANSHEVIKATVVNRLDCVLSIEKLPAVIPPGQLRRLQFLSGDLMVNQDTVRPFVNLATGRRFVGRQKFSNPNDYFYYNRQIGKNEDILR
jgi:hypothetical protein